MASTAQSETDRHTSRKGGTKGRCPPVYNDPDQGAKYLVNEDVDPSGAGKESSCYILRFL